VSRFTNSLLRATSVGAIEVIRRVALWRWTFRLIAVITTVVLSVTQHTNIFADTGTFALEIVVRIADVTQAVNFVAAISTSIDTIAH